jgi:hypothetical protein
MLDFCDFVIELRPSMNPEGRFRLQKRLSGGYPDSP